MEPTKVKIQVNRAAVEAALQKLETAVQQAIAEGIQGGVYHLPASEHNALWVASDLLQKSGKYPQYQFRFYPKGMGEGTHTCAVTFTPPHSGT
ncbi:MAG: hypothetical protein ACUVSQ_04760 [Pseudanabaenaceae cyanobacterium]